MRANNSCPIKYVILEAASAVYPVISSFNIWSIFHDKSKTNKILNVWLLLWVFKHISSKFYFKVCFIFISK